jgi:hypothetical protein
MPAAKTTTEIRQGRPRPRRHQYSNIVLDGDPDSANALQPFYILIGKIASLWGAVEQIIDDMIWTLADVQHDKGACITSQLQSLYPRFKALSALVEMHGGEAKVLKGIEKTSGIGVNIGQQRNRAVHDPISYNPISKRVSVHRITADKRLVMELTPIDESDYRKTLEEISAYYDRIMQLRTTIYTALPSFCDKLPPQLRP